MKLVTSQGEGDFNLYVFVLLDIFCSKLIQYLLEEK
jgi:hypothetical protein